MFLFSFLHQLAHLNADAKATPDCLNVLLFWTLFSELQGDHIFPNIKLELKFQQIQVPSWEQPGRVCKFSTTLKEKIQNMFSVTGLTKGEKFNSLNLCLRSFISKMKGWMRSIFKVSPSSTIECTFYSEVHSRQTHDRISNYRLSTWYEQCSAHTHFRGNQ